MFADVEKSKEGVYDLLKQFNLPERLQNAESSIQELFHEKTMAYPDATYITRNISRLNGWFVKEFNDKDFAKTIGFTQETYDLGIWAGTDVAVSLQAKVRAYQPLLLMKVDPKTKKMVPIDIKKSLRRRFYDDTLERLDRLKIKGKGM